MPATAGMAPNVLMVVFDTARADATAPYGAPPDATPALQQLADQGRAVPHAMAPSCWTVPSHISLLTGVLPRSAGMGPAEPGVEGWGHVVRGAAPRSLPTVLGHHGWESAGVSANAWVSSAHGFDTGFDEFHLVSVQRQGRVDASDWRTRLTWLWESLRARVDDGAAEVERLLDAWAARPRRRPFLWFANLVECHSPYLPPRPYTDLGPIGRVAAGLDAQRWQTFEAINRTCLGGPAPPPEALDRMRHLYRRSIALMDDWLARVLEMLDRHRILDETVVLVTSDHGENFGEGGLIGHAHSLDDRLLRVPLVIAGPGTDHAPLPESGAFGLSGVPALLGHLLDVDDHPWGAPDRTGVAVAQLDPPVRPSDPRAQEALVALGLDDHPTARQRLLGAPACATDGVRKLFRHADEREELIDLTTDPAEARPLPVPDAAETTEDVAWLRAALDQAAQFERPAPPPEPDGGSSDQVADLEERMRLLGYL